MTAPLTFSSLLEHYYGTEYRVTTVKPPGDNIMVVTIEQVVTRMILPDTYRVIQKYRLTTKPSDAPLSYTNIENAADTCINWLDYSVFAESCFNENQMDDRRLDLLHCAVGMSEEAGEIVGLIKKHVYHSKDLDRAKLLSECGDFLWYYANFLRLTGLTLFDILLGNRIKLKQRYPNGRDKNFQLNSPRDENVENDLIIQATKKL